MNGAGGDVIDGDVMRREFQADGACQHAYAAFGAAVGYILWHSQVFVNRRDVDDTSGCCTFDHCTRGSLSAEKSALQIDTKHFIELIFRDIEEGAVYLHACIVDQDVQAIEVVNRLLNKSHGLLVLRNVGLDNEGLAIVLGDDLSYFFGFVLGVGIVDDNGCPFFGKLNGNGAAYTAIGSGDDGDFLI